MLGEVWESVLGCGEGKRKCGEKCRGFGEKCRECVGVWGSELGMRGSVLGCGEMSREVLGEVWKSVLGCGEGKSRCGEKCRGVGKCAVCGKVCCYLCFTFSVCKQHAPSA